MAGRQIIDRLDCVRPKMMQLLAAVREHLQMDACIVTELRYGERIINFIDASYGFPLATGDRSPARESYCHFVAEGSMPELMIDASQNNVAASLPSTWQLPIGATISIPLHREDGEVYGMLCSFSCSAKPEIGRREYEFARMAGIVCESLLHQAFATSEQELDQLDGLSTIIRSGAVDTVFQPIYRLRDTRLVAFESLSRFSVEPQLAPDKWFDFANRIGCGIQLETLAAHRAVELLERDGVSLSFNLSPQAILSGALHQILLRRDPSRYLVEITEHAPIDDYAAVNAKLSDYRKHGLRVAIDDVGAGHSSFRHILELHPEIIKLDISLTRSIDRDRGRRALASALTTFSRDMGCEVVAEGVETDAEMAHLRAVGVTKIQGYYLGRPMSKDAAQQLPLTLNLANAA